MRIRRDVAVTPVQEFLVALLVGLALITPAGADLLNDVAPPGTPAPPPVRFVGALDDRCVVSILNRVAHVQQDGSWEIDNVPTNFGLIRARATCVVGGQTIAGQSDPFTVPQNGVVHAGWIQFLEQVPVPTAVDITSAPSTLTSAGATAQLTVTARFSDGSTRDVTTNPSTTYAASRPGIATVSPAGVVTAVASGTAVITVLHEAVSGFVIVPVSLSSTDTDGDGIPDDVELANGLNPNDPTDAAEDLDGDGLTNLQEYRIGTDMRNPDTDGDGLLDGVEVFGTDGYVTNPLVADTDGDGIPDGVEIETGSDPTDPTSYNLARALQSFDVQPSAFALTVNTVVGEASRQLKVTGHLIDGRTTIDLTSTARRTTYVSSDLTVCTLGPPDGRVFAANNGACTITVANSGFSAKVTVVVQTFAPVALSFLDIPGFANDVDVNGTVAYVAAGAAGVQVVDVSNRAAPRIAAAVDTAGNANDVKLAGVLAFVADGLGGLRILDVHDPLQPVAIGAVATPGVAQGVAVTGTLALVADGAAGLAVIDVGDPTAPALLATVDTAGTAKAVAADASRPLAVVADGAAGIVTVDLADPAHPALVGSVSTAGDARGVAVRSGFAFVADFVQGFTVVDVTDPMHPTVVTSLPRSTGGLLTDVALVNQFAFGADVFFVNGVPIVDVSTPSLPLARAILDFGGLFRDDNGTGIAADGAYVYLTAEAGTLGTENGTVGTTRLYVGQYLALDDEAGIPPSITITSPVAGTTVVEGATVAIAATATDDVGVAAVAFTVNGQPAGIDTSAPYATAITVPTGVPSLTLGATATDFGGNVGVAPDVVVTVVPDPGTTVSGTILDPSGNPVAGATVVCRGVTGTTAADGTFTLSAVPTNRGDIVCTASLTLPDASLLEGTSGAVPAVGGGTTGIGTLTLRLVGFVPNTTADGADATPGDGHCETATGNHVCTLRAAIQETNALPGLHEIRLPAGTYTLTIPATAFEDFAVNGDLDIRSSLTLTGDGADTTIVQACAPVPPATTCTGIDRVFHVDPAGSGITVTIRGVTIRNGFKSSYADYTGGAIFNNGTLTITDSVISGNTATNPSGVSSAGGLFNQGTLTLVGSVVRDNTSGYIGGGIVNTNGGTLTLTRSSVSGNTSGYEGGGIYTGSAFSNPPHSKMIATDSTISDNTSSSGSGGGIIRANGTLTMTNCTVSGNTAVVSPIGGNGGGLATGSSGDGPNILRNCTISGNSGLVGGGILNGSGPLTLINCTITGNSVHGIPNCCGGGGGGINNQATQGAITLANSIVAGNTADPGQPPDCAGPLHDGGFNLIGDGTGASGVANGGNGNQIGTGASPIDAKLAPLADNGGPTATQALLPGSPAIDAANPLTPGSGGYACPATDQRGVSRPQPTGGRCDVGAFELVQP